MGLGVWVLGFGVWVVMDNFSDIRLSYFRRILSKAEKVRAILGKKYTVFSRSSSLSFSNVIAISDSFDTTFANYVIYRADGEYQNIGNIPYLGSGCKNKFEFERED